MATKKKTSKKNGGGGDKKITAKDILPWVLKRKTFTTGQVASEFGVSDGTSAALVAILRIKDTILPSEGKGNDGTSQWTVA
jgi:hypothetical protein